MIVDGLNLDGQTFEADVCVVGAGAAGLNLATDLAERGVSVLLVESGGLKFHEQSHRLLDIESSKSTPEGLVGLTRERFFGGTTNHWGGVCRTLDAFEFEERPWIPHSGWPITRNDLQPYYESAALLLNFPNVDPPYDPQALGVGELPQLVAADSNFDIHLTRRAPPGRIRMGPWRQKEIQASEKIQCVLNATVGEIVSDAAGEQILSLQARTYSGANLAFKARDFVLCTGAIENARLLLMSDKTVPGGIGNQNDLVGRYFMDHIANGVGRYLPLGSVGRTTQEEVLSESQFVVWATSPEARREHELMGFIAFFINHNTQDPLENEHAVRGLAGTPAVAVKDESKILRRSVLTNWEQAPNPQSRIVLSSARDDLGLRKARLEWNIGPEEAAKAQRSAELLSLEVARSGHGRIHLGDLTRKPVTVGGGHQMGTTRMSDDPKTGVTDKHGRVHGVENLFIGGSSLFPTGGWQHPTFTIVALALRQAEYLSRRFPAET
jgi:choline dehydrogenase-like flavoprotein